MTVMQRIGFVVFPGFQVMGLAVISAFEFANVHLGKPVYEVQLLSENGGTVRASMGMNVMAEPFGETNFDTLILGGGTEIAPSTPGLIEFVGKALERHRRVAATCTGAFVLAEAGLLDGRRATTHWRDTARLAAAFPEVQVDQDVLFVDHGDVATSAGTGAGIDLCLHLVRSDHGSSRGRLHPHGLAGFR